VEEQAAVQKEMSMWKRNRFICTWKGEVGQVVGEVTKGEESLGEFFHVLSNHVPLSFITNASWRRGRSCL
jgi:hypothetical protein